MSGSGRSRLRALLVDPASPSGVTHATTGALTGQGSPVTGAATRFRAHPSSGALTGSGSQVVGSASRASGVVIHGTTGALTGQGSTIVGSASNYTVHGSSGAAVGQGSATNGSASRFRAFSASGSLNGGVSIIAGVASRSGVSVSHDTSGALSGGNAVVSGVAQVSPSVVADTHDGYFYNLWKKAAEREKKKRETIEKLEDDLIAVEQEIIEVKAKPIPSRPIVIQSIPLPPIEAKAVILERLITQAARLREEIEEEEILLLM